MKVNVMKLYGPWDAGYVLDRHVLSSEMTGYNEHGHIAFNTIRSDAGEAAYQLKYKSDFSQLQLLSNAIATEIVPKLGFISFVAPIPPSKTRFRQPVIELAREVGKIISKPCLENVLVKHSATSQMKDISRDERKSVLLSSFSYSDTLANDCKYNILLIDDLYSSGATFEAACTILRQYQKIQCIYVAAVSRTK
ncbi:MAG: ComF family protein [Gammaproteobacteria bacterium]|nr:MAG: ComF family protein [Gammaproteobacteria bacterium]